MPTKSLYQQISNPTETYIDGYGQTREVYEPKYVGVLRKAYNLANRFLNVPSWSLWEKPERTFTNLKETPKLMNKNPMMGEWAEAPKKGLGQLNQINKKVKGTNNYPNLVTNPEATINNSAGFFKDGFHYKQGGILKRK